MIGMVSGTLGERDGDTILIETAGGVGYAVTVPLGVLERLPPAGAEPPVGGNTVQRSG